ncbi:MAG: hypothetical protein FRX49_02032 [Trebouxia sp. A1-2]|nr:MAG: hypothetical protein FRX49_02032 [Trebouxia sp. A1-2]
MGEFDALKPPMHQVAASHEDADALTELGMLLDRIRHMLHGANVALWYAEKGTLQELSTEEREALAVDAIQAWCCFLNLLGAAFLTPGAAVGQAMIQAALGLWKHMVQLASKVTTGEDPASKAATWTLIADCSSPVLLALAAMPPGMCDTAGPGQDVVASSAVSQAIEWLVTSGPGEGILITLLHKVAKKCSGPAGRKAQQSANKPIQDAHKLVLTALVGETSRLMSHCSGRNTHGIQRVLLQTVANADCNGLHEANYEPWQKLCDDLNMCKQLEVQQHFLLHIITEALAHKEASRHQVLDRWLDMWPHIWMLAALMSKLRQQIGIDSSVIMSQAGAQPSGIVQMQLLATILQKMCCIMAELYRSDSPAGLRSFIQYHKSAEELYSELCHQMVALPAQDEGDPQLAYQTRWQPGHASIRAELSSSVYLPMTLDVCSALMRAITTYMLAVDAFAESAEEMTAAVAFAAQVLQIPLEFVKQSVAAGGISIVTEMSAGPESDVAERPEGPSKDEGQDARGTAGASKEVHADMGEGAVELSGQDVVSWYMPWQDLYLVVAQVARRSQACAADHTAALATYLLSFAAAMRQSNVDKVTPMSPSTMSGFGLATPAASLQPQRPLLQNAAAAKTSLEHVCHAALASPGIGMGYLSALLDAVPDAFASFADTQPLMTAVAACIQLADHVTDRRTTLQLEAAWKAVIAAFSPRSMLQLSQVSIDELFLQPMATALKYGSQAMRDMTQEFWGNSGIGSVLSAFDVSIVESALAPPEHPSNLVQLALRKAMSAGILTTMSAMTAMSDSGSLEIEMDADPADAPHTADAMAEGDSVDAIANVALAPAQAKAVVKTQVQLAAVSMDKMARTSCGHATRPMPANQARTAEVKAVHTKRVTFAATSPNKAATSHVATAVTGAKQGEASGSHQQPREEDASSSQADQVSRQHTDNRWKGRTRGTARKDSCLDEQPVESVKVASESHTALDSEPLPSQRIAKGKGRFKHRTQGKKKKRGEGSGAGESRKHDKKLSSQAHAQSKRCKTRHHRKQRVTELGSLGDVEPVKDSGPLKSKLSEAKEEMSRAVEATSQNLSRLPSKPGQAAHAFAGTASLPSSAHHIGHGAQAAQGAEARGIKASNQMAASFRANQGAVSKRDALFRSAQKCRWTNRVKQCWRSSQGMKGPTYPIRHAYTAPGFGEAHLSLLQASLPVDGLIGQGRQKATEEVASGRSSAAAHSTDVHDSPGLYLGLDNEHQVLEDTHSGTVATVKVGSLVASSVATTEVVQATAVQHEHVSTAQSARPEQDACFSEMPSKSLGLTPVDAVVNRDQINRDILGQSVTALSTGDQQGRIAPDRARPASSSSAGPASRQASLAVKRHAECSADAEMSALKKARNGLHVDQEPRQHPEGTGTSIQDMQVCAKWPVQVGLASPPSLSMQDLSAGSELVQQILQAVNIDAKTILPEAAKQASVVASLQLKKAYCSGYKDAKHEIAEHCMKTSG